MAKPKNKTNHPVPGDASTIHQFADMYLMHYQTAKKWLKENGVPVHKMGLRTWIWHNDLIDYFERDRQNETKPL